MVKYFLSIILLVSTQLVMAGPFDDAQRAAAAGQYDQVVSILSDAIVSGDLEPSKLVIAYSNRGIAYSLMKSYALSRKDLQRAVELNPNHGLSLNHLGILAEHVDADPQSAFQWYKKAAAVGFAAGQVNLAKMYENGVGTKQNYAEALKYYDMAADQNYPMAYVPLGVMTMQGLGVKRDSKKAVSLFKQAASQGVIEANYYLGKAYEKGRGVAKNLTEAANEYQTAAMQGHAPAQNALGYLFRRGAGVAQSYLEAAKWYRLAADQGNTQAANRLAWLLATCPTEKVCDGEAAVELAKKAVSAQASASNLDSLAAAYARMGNYDQAIATIEEILATKSNSKYRSRLDLYLRGQPYQL